MSISNRKENYLRVPPINRRAINTRETIFAAVVWRIFLADL